MTDLIVRELRLRTFGNEAADTPPMPPANSPGTVVVIGAGDTGSPGISLVIRNSRRRATRGDRAL